MHKARKDRWGLDIIRRYTRPRNLTPRKFKGTPQYGMEQLLIRPFTGIRKYDEETGRAYYVPIEHSMTPTGIEVLDRYLQWIYLRAGQQQDFCDMYGMRLSDLDGLIFVLTGMRGIDFRLTYQMRLADELLRYTDLSMKEVGRLSGIGSAVNLYLSYTREYDYAPGERRRRLRKPGDVGRYRLDANFLKGK